MTRRTIKQPKELKPGENQPTDERLRHGPIERLDRAITDAQNNPSRPYRALDTLAIMERRGSITSGMRQAGEDFRVRFATAQLDPLRALDISQRRLGNRGSRGPDEGPGLRIEAARETVLAGDPVGWRDRLSGRIVHLACCRLGVLAEGVGDRARLERPPRQPGSRVRNSCRRTWRTGSTFQQRPDDAKTAYYY